ncbi:Serine/threonine-protein kinase [Drechslerella dactyloides]|uniref:Serine/threonine-protein kinase n=1 Tax=Drechslerella dactyloides TaxID=74499 RepID=A0AAD6J1H5_DREDA|nr:Serine/threonine-protein kinase [Drechslerella dactyloides]
MSVPQSRVQVGLALNSSDSEPTPGTRNHQLRGDDEERPMDTAEFGHRRFHNLRLATPAAAPQTSSLSEGLAAQSLQRRLSSTPPVSEHASTPPISVTPTGATVSRTEINVHGAFGRSGGHRSPDESSHLGRNGIGGRRKSITFAPNVKLDSGQQLPLQQPLPRHKDDLPSEDSPIALHIYGSSPPNPRKFSFTGVRRGSGFDLYDNRSEDDDSQSSRGGYGSSIGSPRIDVDAMSDRDERDRIGSLTSASTASPMLDEAKTPPTIIDNYLSPIGHAARSPQSLQDEHTLSPWPWSGSSNVQRSKSFSVDKPRTTRAQRQASCPTSNSPASRFLGGWKKAKAAAPDDEGQSIGDYIIGKPIGFGGYSVVKEAHTIERGRKIVRAVKIVKKRVRDSEAENDAIQAEFEHEVNLWRHISHPHILGLLSVYDTSYAYFCITRYNIGGTLFDLVKKNRSGLDPDLVRKYTFQLSSALRYLHQDMRIVHRDVKLENVLVNVEEDPSGHILLCDFGMAEYMSSSHPDADSDDDGYDNPPNRPPIKRHGPAGSSTAIAATSDSPVLGSLQYAAPELLLSDSPIIQTYVDIWALGVTVYTMMTGNLPFQHNMSGILQEMIIKGEYDKELLCSKAAGGHEDVVDLLEGCIDMDIDSRWDITQVLESRWLEDLSEEGF